MSQYQLTKFSTNDPERVVEWMNRWGFLIDERFTHILPDADTGHLNVIYKSRRHIGECEIPTEQQKKEALWT